MRDDALSKQNKQKIIVMRVLQLYMQTTKTRKTPWWTYRKTHFHSATVSASVWTSLMEINRHREVAQECPAIQATILIQSFPWRISESTVWSQAMCRDSGKYWTESFHSNRKTSCNNKGPDCAAHKTAADWRHLLKKSNVLPRQGQGPTVNRLSNSSF